MKAHSLTFYSVAALLAFSLSSTKESVELPISRMPASEQTVAVSTVSVVNVSVTLNEQSEKYSNELKQLKIKLANLEKEVADKKHNDQQITEANKKEIADLKLSIKDSEEKIKEIADLKLAMNEAKKKSEEEIQTIQCISKRHETELEAQIQKQLKDKEDILKEFESLKSEMKLSKETKKEAATPAPVASTPDQSSNASIVALMAQITSMFQSQQQMQMQMQMQMFSMFPQTNYNPYAQSMMNNSLSNSLGNYGGYGIGMNGYNFSQNPYSAAGQTPYAAIPMERSQIPFDSGFGLGPNGATPGFSGYDFSNNSPAVPERFSPPVLAVGQAT